ncbi:histidine phosphatase family protein [Hyphomicrobiales bacterium 4NK60-0047b]
MLDLYILRHAKSSWKDESLEDFDRPLNKRGKLNAASMGEFLSGSVIQPDMVLCSTAKRCKQTLKLLLSSGFSPSQQKFLDRLYLARADEIMNEIQSSSNLISSLMIIGHNPGLEDLVQKLIKDKTSSDYLSLLDKFPTCAFAQIQFNKDNGQLNKNKGQFNTGSWTKLAPNSGTLYCYLTPKHHLSQDN